MTEFRPYDRPVITRAEAKVRKLRHYFTGLRCKHGHTDQRFTDNGSCLTCCRLKCAEWGRRNVEKRRPKKAAWNRAFYAARNATKAESVTAAEMAFRAENPGFTTKNLAMEMGLDRYMVQSPCKSGHIADRYTLSGECVECSRLRAKIYYLSNRKKLLASSQRWVNENRERSREAKRRYAVKHPYQRKTVKAEVPYHLDKEKIRASYVKWVKANPEKVKVNRRNGSARRKQAEGTHTAADIMRIGTAQRWRCGWCRVPCKNSHHVDHITPLSRGGSNWPSNLVISCEPCNLKKHAKHPLDFARERGMLL